ncbi:hypothetical protein FHT78_004889 [Rhizobium sp. BK196]|uniref:hypothetical protein n=1 Tax=Rhizobium sp. BK196 TaxID=2587073 RepID=UPI001616BA0A|nr:hypothetical protein [Rhizobium sp. BK196]MBB3313101.1 hypothetical protein [Rhizobium sp. BK196]
MPLRKKTLLCVTTLGLISSCQSTVFKTGGGVSPLGIKPDCDNSTHICKTKISEVHQDDPGDTRVRLVYDAPAGVSFTNPARGVEVEAGGAEHHVHVFLTGSQNFECEWFAKKKLFGDNGLAKGYCYVTFTGTAP